VGLLNVVTPVSPPDGDDAQLGDNDGSPDSSGDFLGTLDSETDVTVKVTDGNESLESGSLTSRGLLLDRGDGHDLVLQVGKELVDDLVLLDGEREEVDLLHGLDLAVVHETTELVRRTQTQDRNGQLPAISSAKLCLTPDCSPW
jgi:hypothetical protein